MFLKMIAFIVLPFVVNAVEIATINNNQVQCVTQNCHSKLQQSVNMPANIPQINAPKVQTSINGQKSNGFSPRNFPSNSFIENLPINFQQIPSPSVNTKNSNNKNKNNAHNVILPNGLSVNSLIGENMQINSQQFASSTVNPRNIINGFPSVNIPINSFPENRQVNPQQLRSTTDNSRNNGLNGFQPDINNWHVGTPGMSRNFDRSTKSETTATTAKPFSKDLFNANSLGFGRTNEENEIVNNYEGERICFRYDRRFQAVSLEEALLNFPDLTMTNWRLSDPPDVKKCYNDQCKTCADSVLQKLEQSSVVNSHQSQNIRTDLNLGTPNSFRTTQQCPRVNLKKRFQMTSSSNWNGKIDNNDLDSIIQKLKVQGNSQWVTRVKKSAVDKDLIGKSYKLKCVSRGEPADQQNQEWVSLCTMCWVWRRLPDQYYPQFVNELICDSDSRCLSGWGTCRQGSKNVDVLKKVETELGNFTWTPLTIESYNTCACEIKSGSGLHPLVNG